MRLLKILLVITGLLVISLPAAAKEVLVMSAVNGFSKYDPSTGALTSKVNCAMGCTIAGAPGTLYTVVGHELRVISLDNGQVLRSYALPASYASEISGLALAPDGSVYATQRYKNSIIRVDMNTGLVSNMSLNTSISEPTGLTFGDDGDLYVCEGGWSSDDVVYRYNIATGNLVEKYTGTKDLVVPRQLITAPSGDIYALNQCAFGLYKLDRSTNQFCEAIPVPSTNYGFDSAVFTANEDLFLNHFLSAETTIGTNGMLARYDWNTGGFTDLVPYTGRLVVADTVPEPCTCFTMLCAFVGTTLVFRRRH